MPKTKNDNSKRGNGRGTVWLLPSGRYRWQVTLGFTLEGKRQALSGTEATKTQAELAMAKAITDHARGLIGASEDITVKAYADKWLSRQKGLAANSQLAYKNELGYALEHLGKLKIKQVKAHHIKDCLSKLSETVVKSGAKKGKPMSHRTLTKIRTRLKSLFREAVVDGYIYVNPCEGVKAIRQSSPEPVGKALDELQMTRLHELGLALYDAGLCRMFPAVFACASLGLRRGEAFGLCWQDIDFTTNTIHIRQNLIVNDGKSYIGNLKTHQSKRDIPLPLSLRNILLRHQTMQHKEQKLAMNAWNDTGAVFATPTGDYAHPANLQRAIKSLISWSDPTQLKDSKLLGVPLEYRKKLETIIKAGDKLPAIRVHDLRHSAATLMLRRKVPVEVVSKILGHARVSITLDIYRQVSEDEKRQLMPDLFDSPLPVREIPTTTLN
jgi:integrase